MITNTNGCTNTSTVYPVTNTGLSESGMAIQGTVYPNPSSGQFDYLSSENGMARFSLFTADGRLVWTDEMMHSGKSRISPLGTIEDGFYLFQVQINGQSEIQRLVIRK